MERPARAQPSKRAADIARRLRIQNRRQELRATPGLRLSRRLSRKADVTVLPVPWDAAPAAIAACGDLTGRVLVDLTNPLISDRMASNLALAGQPAALKQITEMTRGAAVAKTMNQVGFAVMAAADP